LVKIPRWPVFLAERARAMKSAVYENMRLRTEFGTPDAMEYGVKQFRKI
jgi:hypothetical protein